MAYNPRPTHHLRFIEREGDAPTQNIADRPIIKRILQQWWKYFDAEDDLEHCGEWRDVTRVPVEKEDEPPHG